MIVAALLLTLASLDGRALVGDWTGAWKSTTGSTGSLTISVGAVEGDQVFGSFYMAVAAPDTQGYYNRTLQFRGFFDGAVLRIYVPPGLSFEITVAPRLMRGAVQGQHTFGTVELIRKP